MNKSYSKIRHIQESNRILETRLIVGDNSFKKNLISEQNENYWGPYMEEPNKVTGRIEKVFPANNELVRPPNKRISFWNGPPLWIGAVIDARRNKLSPSDHPDSATAWPGSKFGYQITFFVSTKQNESPQKTSGVLAPTDYTADLFVIQCTKNKSVKGRFDLLATPILSDKLKKIGFKEGPIKDNIPLSSSQLFASNMLFGDLSGWTGSLMSEINTELSNMGFPNLPNAVTPSFILKA